jgi:hypothetical protein
LQSFFLLLDSNLSPGAEKNMAQKIFRLAPTTDSGSTTGCIDLISAKSLFTVRCDVGSNEQTRLGYLNLC